MQNYFKITQLCIILIGSFDNKLHFKQLTTENENHMNNINNNWLGLPSFNIRGLNFKIFQFIARFSTDQNLNWAVFEENTLIARIWRELQLNCLNLIKYFSEIFFEMHILIRLINRPLLRTNFIRNNSLSDDLALLQCF